MSSKPEKELPPASEEKKPDEAESKESSESVGQVDITSFSSSDASERPTTKPQPPKVPRKVIVGGAMPKPGGPSIASLFEKLEYGEAPENKDALDAWMKRHNDSDLGLFIDNEWIYPKDCPRNPQIAPGTGKPFYSVVDATVEEVDHAVASAHKAWDSWSKTSGYYRAKILYAIARGIQKHHRLLAVMEALDNGKTIRESRDIDIPLTSRHFLYHAGWAQLMETELRDFKPYYGPMAQIVPLNFPLLMLAWKVAPALAMGNTIVLKPAPLTPLTAMCFVEICAEAGLPPGVMNLVTGGRVMATRLTVHPDISKVDFCGSTVIGQTVRRATAGTGKSVTLQMSGKSPIVVFEDADLDSAIEGVVDSIYRNQGQVCSAGSRLIVQESIADRFIKKLKRRIDTLRVGFSLEKNVDVAAVLAGTARIERLVKMAEAEGAEIYRHPGPIPTEGDYYPPTLITNVEPVSTVVQTEIFGPVLSCLTFRTPSEAIALANNSRYGLGGGVFSENINLALDVAFRIKAGIVWVNCYNLMDAAAAFGGTRESGYGRQGGYEGLMNYVKPKWRPHVKIDPGIPQEEFEERRVAWAKHVFGQPVPTDVPLHPHTAARIDRTPKLYIGGKQVRPDGHYVMPIIGEDGMLVGHVGDGNRKDVRDAVQAAHNAFPGWGKRGAYNRSQILYYMAENLDARHDEFAQRIKAQTGRSLESCSEEVELSKQRLFSYAAWADKYGGTIQETTLYGVTLSVREPIGVIAIICPDDYPLLSFISLFAPAICRGNTIVIVASEKHPLCVTDLYQVFDTSDLPGGVVNILTGSRAHLSSLLAEHQDVQSVWDFDPKPEGSYFVEYLSALNCKRTFCDFGIKRDWTDRAQGEGHEFLHEAIDYKNIWVPFGE